MPDNHEEMLRDWRKNASSDEEENFRFLRSLKLVSDQDRIDSLARKLHDEAFARIDCTRCANCCKTMQPNFTKEDTARIATHLGLTPEEVIAAHLEPDPLDGGHRTRMTPCPFLGGDDRCPIYQVRPQACREFPHTDKEDFTSRTYLHSGNTLSCPAVYHVVKRMRRRLRRR